MFQAYGDYGSNSQQAMGILPYWQKLLALGVHQALRERPPIGAGEAHIFLRFLAEGSVNISLSRGKTVLDMKLKISEQEGIKIEVIHLFYAGEELQNEHKVVFNTSEVGNSDGRVYLRNESSVHILLRPYPQLLLNGDNKKVFQAEGLNLQQIDESIEKIYDHSQGVRKNYGNSNNWQMATQKRATLSIEALKEPWTVINESLATAKRVLQNAPNNLNRWKWEGLARHLKQDIETCRLLIADHLLATFEQSEVANRISESCRELLHYFGVLGEQGRTAAQRSAIKCNPYLPQEDENRLDHCVRLAKEVKRYYETIYFLKNVNWTATLEELGVDRDLGEVAKQALLQQMSNALLDLYQAGKTNFGLADVEYDPNFVDPVEQHTEILPSERLLEELDQACAQLENFGGNGFAGALAPFLKDKNSENLSHFEHALNKGAIRRLMTNLQSNLCRLQLRVSKEDDGNYERINELMT